MTCTWLSRLVHASTAALLAMDVLTLSASFSLLFPDLFSYHDRLPTYVLPDNKFPSGALYFDRRCGPGLRRRSLTRRPFDSCLLLLHPCLDGERVKLHRPQWFTTILLWAQTTSASGSAHANSGFSTKNARRNSQPQQHGVSRSVFL